MWLRLSAVFEGSGLNRGETQVLLSKTKLRSCTMKVQVFIQREEKMSQHVREVSDDKYDVLLSKR